MSSIQYSLFCHYMWLSYGQWLTLAFGQTYRFICRLCLLQIWLLKVLIFQILHQIFDDIYGLHFFSHSLCSFSLLVGRGQPHCLQFTLHIRAVLSYC